MCQTHGKLIDTDEVRYTIPQLRKWRELAERRARFLQNRSSLLAIDVFVKHLGLPEHELKLRDTGQENEAIGNAINDSCVPQIWGNDVAHAIRDFAVELARNSFEHGRATCFSVEISPDSIDLIDDGEDFDPQSLAGGDLISGGRLATSYLIDRFSDKLVIASMREGQTNKTTIALVSHADQILDITPCTIQVTWRELKDRRIPLRVHKSCRVVYVILPPYFSISDAIAIHDEVEELRLETRPLVFVLRDTSPRVRELITQNFPNSRILNLSL